MQHNIDSEKSTQKYNKCRRDEVRYRYHMQQRIIASYDPNIRPYFVG